MSLHPEIIWAQRSDKLFVTVELPDAKDSKVDLDPDGKFSFSAKAGPNDQQYEASLELFEHINVEKSKTIKGSRHIICMIEKAEKGWWPRLLKAAGRSPPFLKADWDKWVDEDDEDEAGQMDPNFLKQFQDTGMSGFDDMEDDDVEEEIDQK